MKMCKRWADRLLHDWPVRVIVSEVMETNEADERVWLYARARNSHGHGYRVCINRENYSQAVICREPIFLTNSVGASLEF